MLSRVLLVVDEPLLEVRVAGLLRALDLALALAPPRSSLSDRIGAFQADLLVVSIGALGKDDPEANLSRVVELVDPPNVIVLVESEAPKLRARLLVAGCVAVLSTTLDDATLQQALEVLVARHRQTRNDRLQRRIDAGAPALRDFDSSNPTMRSFLSIVRRVAAPGTSLLIQGETGVGKERLTRAIHAESQRAAGPFVPITLSAMPESLLEAELFGHTKGAFTGAVGSKRGCFELAHGGTLLLDEIGELPLHLQVKLLRVLQDRKVQRLGGTRTLDVDVRVVAATNRDLKAEVAAGRFREDLFYRLSVITLEVPPLRSHPEDVAALAKRYLQEFRRLNPRVRGFTAEALVAMTNYRWPGNIRELINVIERAVLLCEGDEISVANLPLPFVDPGQPPAPRDQSILDGLPVGAWRQRPWRELRASVLSSCERAYFQAQFADCGGSVEQTAVRAGLNPRSLYDLLKRHGLSKEQFRGAGERPQARGKA